MPPTQIPTSTFKSHGSSSKFDEGAWYNKWNGFDVRLHHCHQVIQEIFDADDAYWKSLDERVRKAVSQNRHNLNSQTLVKFDETVRARKTYLKNPSKFFAGYGDFEMAYADALFLKDLIGALSFGRSGGTRVDTSAGTKSGTRTLGSSSASKGKGSVMPKLDSAIRAGEKTSGSTSTKGQGSLMPKLDSSRAPSRPPSYTTMPTPSSSIHRQVGSLLPSRDNRPGYSTSSSSQQVSADGNAVRRETHER